MEGILQPDQLPFVIDDFYHVGTHGTPATSADPSATNIGGSSGISGGWLENPLIVNDYFNTRNADNEVCNSLTVTETLTIMTVSQCHYCVSLTVPHSLHNYLLSMYINQLKTKYLSCTSTLSVW